MTSLHPPPRIMEVPHDAGAARSGDRLYRSAEDEDRLSRGEEDRPGRRLSRDLGPRSLPLARGRQFRGDAGLGQGPERRNIPISRRPCPARAAPRAPDRALALPPLRDAVRKGRPVFLLQERRSPEPVGALQAGFARLSPTNPSRSPSALGERDG